MKICSDYKLMNPLSMHESCLWRL